MPQKIHASWKSKCVNARRGERGGWQCLMGKRLFHLGLLVVEEFMITHSNTSGYKLNQSPHSVYDISHCKLK